MSTFLLCLILFINSNYKKCIHNLYLLLIYTLHFIVYIDLVYI